MIVNSIRLENFRNHEATEVNFAPGINLITGRNGMGKTNLIDAIHYLCMSRSFATSSDMYVVRQGSSGFFIEAQLSGSIRSAFGLSCSYSRGEGKKFRVNDSPLERLSDLIGIVPVVVLSPDDKRLTNEGPAERRSFLDAMISQVYRSYLTDLLEYRRIIRQRNRLLSMRNVRPDLLRIQLEPWNQQLAKSGAKIIERRRNVLARFARFLEDSYALISGIGLKPSFEYKTIAPVPEGADETHIAGLFAALIEDNHDKETERQMTLFGPHRDDLVFYLDGMELRKFGSQGQHRLFALALKLAQLAYFSDTLDDLPVFLLDDVFGDLDPAKVKVLADMLNAHTGQAFITAANQTPFEGLIPFDTARNRHFSVTDGPQVSPVSAG
ncbi:MAG: DNA replication and repair protein RecF [Candidatus Cyclonatronum sp.]|uniref:DNA replication/repair protein RecF n=1 Tax=Cyclonatronum sp. TaxID=3024185 RepID=UPI0025C4D570|nr:DNA replication and repair protein RecF [Cyclonatronum sp.]MCC5934608.1 DNA replication and repair protein RecF [Balneolales bacterium]MCH8485507.1 DNA replication and repair protein RecF [Cyclonatronum sp.]